MKIVINACYGGFCLSNTMVNEINAIDEYDDSFEVRTNPRLIETVLMDSGSASGHYSHLIVNDIPDDATDWYINSYDGLETIIYVVDGKLHGIQRREW